MMRGKPLMSRSANGYDLYDVRSAVWTIALVDVFVTATSAVLFVVLLFTPPMNPLLLYMLMNILHLFISSLLFFSVNRNSVAMVTYVVYWMALVSCLDVVTFFIRTIGFGRCAECLRKGYLLGTLFPYAINFVYLVTDSIVFWKLCALRNLMRSNEAARALPHGTDGGGGTGPYERDVPYRADDGHADARWYPPAPAQAPYPPSLQNPWDGGRDDVPPPPYAYLQGRSPYAQQPYVSQAMLQQMHGRPAQEEDRFEVVMSP